MHLTKTPEQSCIWRIHLSFSAIYLDIDLYKTYIDMYCVVNVDLLQFNDQILQETGVKVHLRTDIEMY